MHKDTKYDLVMTLTTLWLLLRALKLLYVGREKSDARVAYVRVQSTAAVRLFTLRTYKGTKIHFALSFDPQSLVFGDFSRSSKDQSVMEIQDGKLSQKIKKFSSNLVKMQCYKWKSALFLALFVFLDSSIVVRAQLPSFLSALYGGGLSGTSTPSPRPKGPPPGLQPRVPRPRFETFDHSVPNLESVFHFECQGESYRLSNFYIQKF